MANILPFRQTERLINEIDEYLDQVAEACMVFEQTILHYLDVGDDDVLEQKMAQIFAIEKRGDEVRRSVATTMYTQMLMPDMRGDVLTLLEELDNVLDDSTHLVAGLVIMRPDLPDEQLASFRALTEEMVKAAESMVQAARAYFKMPQAVRDYTNKISFHETECNRIVLRMGKAIFDSDLPLEQKRHITDFAIRIRDLASHADDVGDRIAIFAVKRSL